MTSRPDSRTALLLLAGVVLPACITINVYFPEAAVRNLSEQIEVQVRERAEELESQPGGAAGLEVEETSPNPAAEAPTRPLRLAILASNLGVTSPAIERIIESRAQRLAEVNRFKDAQVLGESNDGHLVLRALDTVTDLRDRALVQRLVKDENADRERLFEEIAAVKDIDRSQLPRIRETHAETLRAQARPGDWLQLPDGTWQRKSAD